jgi:hypothetical protein
MGKVYMATQTMVGRRVVIKVIAPQLAMDESFRERFLQEATCGALDHPNIVKIYDAGMTKDLLYIVMEFLPGGDLSRHIKQGMAEEEILHVTRQVAAALGHSHKNNIIHRDVKPANVLFRADGTAVLMDFGIAKVRSTNKSVTQVGMVVGSSHYMSPEQARGEEVDGRSDLYSLGIVLFEMLTGQKPYDGIDTYVVGLKHIKDPIPRLPSHLQKFQPVIDKSLAKNPADRYQTAEEMIDDLNRVALSANGKTRMQERIADAATAAIGSVVPTGQAPSRISMLAISSLILVLVAVGVVFLSTRESQEVSAPIAPIAPTAEVKPAPPKASDRVAAISEAPPIIEPKVVEPKLRAEPVKVKSISDAAKAIVEHLGRNGTYVYPPHPEGAVEITPFGRAILKKVEERLKPINPDRDKKTFVLNGSYTIGKQNEVTLEYRLFDNKKNKIDQLAVILPASAYSGNRVKPHAPDVAQMFIQPSETKGDFTSALWTNRGDKDLLFNEGETVKLFVRLTKPGYFYIVGHVVREGDEYSYLVELSNKNAPQKFITYVPPEKANRDIEIGEFIVKPPFGLEYLQLVASTEDLVQDLPKTKFDLVSGYYIIEKSHGSVKSAIATVRGLQLKMTDATTHESQLAITTMAGR